MLLNIPLEEDLTQLTDDLGLSVSSDSSLLTTTLESIVSYMSDYVTALETMDTLTQVDLDDIPNETIDTLVSGSMSYVKNVLSEDEIQEILDSHLNIGLSSASAWYSVGNEAIAKRRGFFSGLLAMLKTAMKIIGQVLGFKAKQLKQGLEKLSRMRKMIKNMEAQETTFDAAISKKWLADVDKSLSNLHKVNNKLAIYDLDLVAISKNTDKHSRAVIDILADIDRIEIEPLPTPDVKSVYKGVVFDVLSTLDSTLRTGQKTMDSLKRLETSVKWINDSVSRAEGHGDFNKETIAVARDFIAGLNKLISKNNIQISVLNSVWTKLKFK